MIQYKRILEIDLLLVPYIDKLDTLLLAKSSPTFTDEHHDAREWILERVGDEFRRRVR